MKIASRNPFLLLGVLLWSISLRITLGASSDKSSSPSFHRHVLVTNPVQRRHPSTSLSDLVQLFPDDDSVLDRNDFDMHPRTDLENRQRHDFVPIITTMLELRGGSDDEEESDDESDDDEGSSSSGDFAAVLEKAVDFTKTKVIPVAVVVLEQAIDVTKTKVVPCDGIILQEGLQNSQKGVRKDVSRIATRVPSCHGR